MFEYKVVEERGQGYSDSKINVNERFEQKLNELGCGGWEVVAGNLAFDNHDNSANTPILFAILRRKK